MPHDTRRYWTTRFAVGFVLLLASGAGLPSTFVRLATGARSHVTVDVLCGLAGFWLAFAAVSPMVRAIADDARLRRAWGSARHAHFADSSAAEQVFQLLFAVASARGAAGVAERELVRRFLLQRFVGPGQADELRRWEANALPSGDVAALARRVARGLDDAECATVYSWCCMVALADGELVPAERAALQQVARGLGVEPVFAKFLLLLAHEMLRRETAGRPAGANGRASSASSSSSPPPRAPREPTSARELALRALDLPPGATAR